MAFGVLAAGHSHPLVAEALQPRGQRDLLHVPDRRRSGPAEEIKQRFGIDLVRFSNSGTEATMDAVRVARGFTGREKILKFEGGYHGHHDDLLVSIQPPREAMGPDDSPTTVAATAGLPRSRLAETIVAPFNQAEHCRGHPGGQPGRDRGDHRGAVQFNIGVVPPQRGFWSGCASWPPSTASC